MQPYIKETKQKTVTTTDWGNDDDDEEWGDDDDWGLSDTVEKMKINEEIKTNVISIGPGFYINVIEDYSSNDLSYEVSDFCTLQSLILEIADKLTVP